MKKLHMYALSTLLVTSPIVLVNTAVAESYTYDAQGRLTSVTTDTGVITYYCYDAAGNRTYVGPTSC